MSDLDRFRAGYQEWLGSEDGDEDNVRALVEALEARVADLEALRAALVRDNRDKTNAVRELQAEVERLTTERDEALAAGRLVAECGDEMRDEGNDLIEALTERVTELEAALADIAFNARKIPDPRMGSSADVYAVPLADIEDARALAGAEEEP